MEKGYKIQLLTDTEAIAGKLAATTRMSFDEAVIVLEDLGKTLPKSLSISNINIDECRKLPLDVLSQTMIKFKNTKPRKKSNKKYHKRKKAKNGR